MKENIGFSKREDPGVVANVPIRFPSRPFVNVVLILREVHLLVLP